MGVHLEFAPNACPVGLITLAEDSTAITILTIAAPRDHEITSCSPGNRWPELAASGVRVDLKLASQGGAAGVVALRVDAQCVTVLPIATPGHDEMAIRIHGDRWTRLLVRRVGIDLKFVADRVARGIKQLSVNSVPISVLVETTPGDHKVPCVIRGHRWRLLRT